MVIIWLMMVNNNLVGGKTTPLKNMSSSVGMMAFPIDGNHVPNHQLVYIVIFPLFLQNYSPNITPYSR